jgi:hypothetical protein
VGSRGPLFFYEKNKFKSPHNTQANIPFSGLYTKHTAMRSIASLLLCVIAFGAKAQEISGTIANDHKENVIIGVVLVKQNGILKGGACTDYDGKYWVKPLDAGLYDVTAFYGSYDTLTITGVPVAQGQKTLQNFTFTQSEGTPRNIVQAYRKQITEDRGRYLPKVKEIPNSETTSMKAEEQHRFGSCALTRQEPDALPTSDINGIVALSPGVYQIHRGDDITIWGSR